MPDIQQQLPLRDDDEPPSERPEDAIPLVYVASALTHLDDKGRGLIDGWCNLTKRVVTEITEAADQPWRLRIHLPIDWTAPWSDDKTEPEEVEFGVLRFDGEGLVLFVGGTSGVGGDPQVGRGRKDCLGEAWSAWHGTSRRGIRDANRRSLSRILSNVIPLVDAWLHRNTASEGRRPAEFTTVADTMTQAGALDFERLTSLVVVRWLHANHQWPIGMPLTTNRAELGLTEQDITDARQRIDQAKEQQRRTSTFVRIDGHTYSADGDLLALADAVRGGLTPALLATPADPLTLSESGVTSTADGETVGFYGSSGRSAPPPPEELKAIGLAGEVAVGEWLRHQIGIAPEESWVSGYRNLILGDGQGDDSLGYDFRIISTERTRLFEVKATVDERPEFTLGETAVRRAQNLQPDEEYTIIFVTHVLESTRRSFTPLPNPLAPGELRHYRVGGRSIRLQFELTQT